MTTQLRPCPRNGCGLPPWIVEHSTGAPGMVAQCRKCYGYCALGPSSDTPAVLVEMRAAEIAADVPHLGVLQLLSDGAEYAGWIEHAYDSAKVPGQPGEWSGWLAREISFHGDLGGEA